jgi:hypothetical protein
MMIQGHPEDEYSVAYLLKKHPSPNGELEAAYERDLAENPDDFMVRFHGRFPLMTS